MPVGSSLKGRRRPDKLRFAKMASNQLKRDWQAVFAEAARQCNCRISSQIERSGKSLQFENQLRLHAESSYGVEAQGSEGLCRTEEDVDLCEEFRKLCAQAHAPLKTLLKLGCRDRVAYFKNRSKHRTVFTFASGVGVFVSQGRFHCTDR